jgi:hypothetical protein
VFRAQADWTLILQSELPTKKAAPLAEKNAATSLSGFSIHGAAQQHFSWQVVQHVRRKF